jgi:tetratricopeptide (TPR) repeat protein
MLLALPGAALGQTPDHSESSAPAGTYAEVDKLVEAGKFDRADRVLQDRMAEGADPATAFFQMGKICFNHQEWQRSATYLEKSLTLKPLNDAGHQMLGLDWRELHRSDDAEAELLEAAKENSANGVNDYFAGQQLLLNGKFEAAMPYLYKAVEYKGIQSQALQALALGHARAGNYEMAESYYRRAIASNGNNGQDDYPALVNLSILLLLGHEQARLTEALNYAERAEKLHPDLPEAHYLVGKAQFKLGRMREALPELERSAAISPNDSKPHFLLAEIFTQLGQPDRARKERERVARIHQSSIKTGIANGNQLPSAIE